jgi:hypothetical protein
MVIIGVAGKNQKRKNLVNIYGFVGGSTNQLHQLEMCLRF